MGTIFLPMAWQRVTKEVSVKSRFTWKIWLSKCIFLIILWCNRFAGHHDQAHISFPLNLFRSYHLVPSYFGFAIVLHASTGIFSLVHSIMNGTYYVHWYTDIDSGIYCKVRKKLGSLLDSLNAFLDSWSLTPHNNTFIPNIFSFIIAIHTGFWITGIASFWLTKFKDKAYLRFCDFK